MRGRIDAKTLKGWLQDGGELAVLDVREHGQYGEGHLFLATSLPYSRLEADLERLVPCRQARLVLYDGGGEELAERAARRAAALGYGAIWILAGGAPAWQEAGYTLYAGVNVPSKVFGEFIAHERKTPSVSAARLQQMMAAGEDFVLLDGRPYAEYQKMNIPGAACCPNGELALRARELARNPSTPIIVNCAGRTRSIIGAQTLIDMGVPNPVFALENGTQGWMLAGFKLENGGDRRAEHTPVQTDLAELQRDAAALMRRHGAQWVASEEAEAWLHDSARSTYLIDVRTAEEYAADHLPGSVHAPGGQLVQATDHWIAVRNARVVLVDGESVRAPVIAAWLRRLGHDAHVLADGIRSRLSAPLPTSRAGEVLPRLKAISATGLHDWQREQAGTVLDLRASMDYRRAHVPGARWSIRPHIGRHAAPAVVLVAEEALVARAAAIDLAEAGARQIHWLEGGMPSWTAAGLDVEASPGQPPDAECIDYLFFVHDRHAGNLESARRYLEWESNLVDHLDEQERSVFGSFSAVAGQ